MSNVSSSKNFFQKSIHDSIYVFLFSLFGALGSYFLRIYLANGRSVEFYGFFFTLWALLSFITIFIDLGFGRSLSKYMLESRVSSKSLLWNAFFYLVFLGILVTSLFYFGSTFFSSLFLRSTYQIPFIVFVWLLFTPLRIFVASILYGLGRVRLTAFFSATFTVLPVVSIVFFDTLADPLRIYYLTASLLSVAWLFVLFYLSRDKLFGMCAGPKKSLFPLVRYGWFMAFTGFSLIILSQIDTLLLSLITGVESAGLYQSAVPVAGILTFVVSVFISVMFPYVIKLRFDLGRLKLGLDYLNKYLLLLSLPLVVLFFSFPDFILSSLFGTDYLLANSALRILLISSLFSILVSLNVNILSAIDRAKFTSKLMMWVILFNIISNSIVITFMGLEGAALTTLLSNIILYVGTSKEIRSVLNYSIDYKLSVLLVLSSVVPIPIIFLLLSFLPTYSVILLGLVILFCYAGIYFLLMYVLKIISIQEILELKENVCSFFPN